MKPDEIILVLDPNPDLAKFYESKFHNDVKIVISDHYGLSNARNAGVKSAEGEIVVFIDSDAIPGKSWLENLVKNYEDPNVVGVGGLVKPFWEAGSPSWFPEELNWVVGCSYKGLPEHKACVRNPIGCNMSFRKDVFEKIGYFRSDIGRFGKKLLAGEEPELSMRILEKIPNSKIIYDPSAVVYHRVNKNRLSLKYLWIRSFYEGVSKALIVNSNLNSSMTLSTENQYLRYLFKVAIPLRLKRTYKFEILCQLFALLFSVFAVSLGFFSTKFVRGK